MNRLWQDVRYGLRMIWKAPGFSAIAVLSLALGIGVNTAIFSLVNTALFRPLPIATPEQLVSLNNTAAKGMFSTFSYPNYRDFRDRNEVFDGLIASRFAPLSMSYEDVNQRLWGYIVSGNYFEVLGVKAALGEVISPADDVAPGGHPVAVLSYKCWQQRFGGAAEIIGKEIFLNGRSYRIIGIAPQGFFGTEVVAAPEIWLPMAMQAQLEPGYAWLERRETENLSLYGRLKAGVSEAQAQTALNRIAEDLEQEFPQVNTGKRVRLVAAGMMGDFMRDSVLGFLALLLIVVALVLLLACTNLANLLMARAAERRREIAVRLALGASRFQLVRQLLTESVLLAGAGGALGLLLAAWLIDLAAGFKPPLDVPLSVELHLDMRVLLFTGAVSLATGVLFGLLPALQASKTDLLTALKDEAASGGYRRSRVKSGLLVLQVALSLMLLIGGGLMLRALARAQTIDLGFNPQNAVEVSFNLRLQGYDEGRSREFQKSLLERVRRLPNVQAAGLADMVPVDLHFGSTSIFIEGSEPVRPADAPRAFTNRISPDYFAAMSTRLVEGRDFSAQDERNALLVAIVNETFARRFFAGESAIGKRFSFGSDAPKLQIIGVAEDGKYANLGETPKPFVYRPLWQWPTAGASLIVRGAGDLEHLLAAVRGEFRELDARLPLSTTTLVGRLSLPLLPARLLAWLLGGFGLLALVLAAIGLYGVMAYAVTQRTREIGIRQALGAQPASILKLVIGQGMTLVLVGIGAGLLASIAVTRLLKNVLYGVSATDPVTFVAVALLLAVVAFIACYLPARRATKVDPMVALRYE